MNEKLREISDYWGNLIPVMFCEEAGEFVHAVSNHERENNEETLANLKGEIRDMYITLALAHIRYGIDAGEIQDMILLKLKSKKDKN